ncbi:MAG TPA: zf-HC2 domain-containing protein [Candidatus Dormibacteraeota bacterium]|nr:zf-HC2 domain-containing protein [Candidatus Dormibacteraeota bacterium]
MSCASCEHRLEEYLEGGLDVYALARVERHLAACASCRATLGELRDLERMLNAASRTAAVEPEHNFTIALMAEVRSMPQPRARYALRWAFLGWYLLAAWMLLGVMAVIARPVLFAGLAALERAGGAGVAILQAAIVAVSAVTGGHAAQIALTLGFVLALDAALATAIYLIHTRLELA